MSTILGLDSNYFVLVGKLGLVLFDRNKMFYLTNDRNVLLKRKILKDIVKSNVHYFRTDSN